MIRRILVCLCVLLGVSAPVRALEGLPPEFSTWQKNVQRFDQVYFDDKAAIEKRRADLESQFGNDRISQGFFSEWGEAYATMYETTGDIKYANALAELVEIAFAFRDDRVGRIDSLTGKVLPAWGMYNPTMKLRSVRLGTSALILSPAARLLAFMKKKPELEALAGMNAATLEQEILRTIHVFDTVLRDVPGRGSRYLIPQATGGVSCDDIGDEVVGKFNMSVEDVCERFRSYAGTPEPFNVQLKMALALQHFEQATGNEDTGRRVAALTQYFLAASGLRRLSDGRAYAYDYIEGGRVEDVSHANLVSEFLAESYLDGLREGNPLVERDVPAGLAAAVVDYASVLAEDPNDGNRLKEVLTPYIDGSRAGNLEAEGNDDRLFGRRTSRIRRSCKTILLLAVFDTRLAGLCGSIMKERGNLSPLGLAYMARALKIVDQYGGEVP